MSPLDDLFSGDDARAEAALSQIDATHLPALAETLASGEPDARWWAACALALLADPGAVATLLTASADPDANVRAAVLQALGQQRAPEAVTPLIFALADPSPYLARLAADALIQVGQPAVPALIRVLDNDVEPAVRINATRALAHIGDPSAIPTLFRALDDPSAMVQYWADEGLERIGVGQVYFQP